MSRKSSTLQSVLILLAIFAALLELPITAFAAPGVAKILNYQGRLADENGALLGGSGTEFCFTFSLWDNATVGVGSKVWPSSNPSTSTVTVKNGIFTAGIGDVSIGGDTLDYNFQDNDTIFLNVQVADKVGSTCAPGDGVETYETLSPRQKIRASGYAINSGTVGGFTPAQSATGNQITALTNGNLILGGTDPFINATTSNALTLQGGGNLTGAIQFFNSTNRITPQGHAIFSGGINAATSSITSATSTSLYVASNFTFSNITGPLQAIAGVVSASSTIAAVYGGTGHSSYVAGDVLYANGGASLARLPVGANGTLLKVVNGVPSWGVAGVVGAWATTSDDLAVYPADTSDVVLVGQSATTTTGNLFEVAGNSLFRGLVTAYNTMTSPFFNATSSTASQLPYASSTAVTVSGTASSSNIIVSNTATIGTLNGPLQAVNGVVSASSSLSTVYGGIGWSAVQAGAVLYGNGTGPLATTSAGANGQVLALANGVPTWVASTTFSDGLTYLNGNVTNTGVTSITGTANQITASGSTGAVTLSLPALLALTNASSTGFSALDYISIGRIATTTIQGSMTGTSTLQGYLNVAGAVTSTSTFTGGVAANRLNVTGTNATSTFAGGINLTDGCFAVDGVCIRSGVDGVEIYASTSPGTAGTWNAPANLDFAQVIVTGAGGGGGEAETQDTAAEAAAGGGGAGATTIEVFSAAELGVSKPITVGAGGAGGLAVNNNAVDAASNGGASYFGLLAGANGGIAGTGVSTAAAPASGGAGGVGGRATTSGDMNVGGGSGEGGIAFAENVTGGVGGTSYWGSGGSGGRSVAQNLQSAGGWGTSFGAGGGGAASEDVDASAAGGTGATGTIMVLSYTSNGADLAEWYEAVADVVPGDIVAVSEESFEYESHRLGLQRTSVMEKATYGSPVVGVVATLPEHVMGGDILAAAQNAKPIALAGRVPVNASMENGPIKAGDHLTISSTPGIAMRATKAGVTIGRALQDADCGGTEDASIETPAVQICKVLTLVNTSYTTGRLLKEAMAEEGVNLDTIPANVDTSRIILAKIMQDKKDLTSSSALSEINTDRLVAGLEIIAPRVIADTLVINAIEPVEKDIRMRIVDGGKLVIERIAREDLTLTFDSATSSENALLVSIDSLGNALFAGALTANGLEIGSADKPAGITMYDNDTKEPYCAKVVAGLLQTFAGKCGQELSAPLADAGTTEPPTNTPIEVPVITIQGNNPAHIDVGDTYIDLGAIVTDDKDHNLGMYTFVDGTEVDHVMLDTASSSEYMIMYRAVDSDGHVAEVIRLVVVGEGAPDELPTEEEDPVIAEETPPTEDSIAEETSTEEVVELSPEQSVVIDAEPAPEQPVAVGEEPQPEPTPDTTGGEEQPSV